MSIKELRIGNTLWTIKELADGVTSISRTTRLYGTISARLGQTVASRGSVVKKGHRGKVHRIRRPDQCHNNNGTVLLIRWDDSSNSDWVSFEDIKLNPNPPGPRLRIMQTFRY